MWLENSTLCSFYIFQEQTLPQRPEAYPIPTQTYTREYFTFPASKSQDRMGPAQSQWPNYEEKPQVQAESNHSINTTMQVRSNFFQYKKKTERTCWLSTPRLLRRFCRTVNSDSWAVEDKLYNRVGNNCTSANIGLGSETLLFLCCRIYVTMCCRPVIWDVLAPR